MIRRLSLLPLVLAAAACGSPPPPAPVPVGPVPTPSASAAPAPSSAPAPGPLSLRLPDDVTPTREALELAIDPKRDRFSGKADIQVTVASPRGTIRLHGKGLHVTRATITPLMPPGSPEMVATWTQKDDSGQAEVAVPQLVPAGDVKVHLEYDAAWSPKLEGLYKVTQAGNPYAFTQFEAISAREAFPCFDEPRFKIPFDTTLIVPADAQAVANTHEVERRTEGDSVRVKFAETLPLPSYLVAFAVGPFDLVAAPDVPANAVRKHPLPLRAVTAKGRGKEVAYALAHTGEILTALEQYFGVEYPYDKLDILAVPDKQGAMENAGAITFADQLLLFDDKTAPLRQKRNYTRVMTHELAHQWTGDLVTTAWWDDIWLNEAFATWATGKIADTVDPKAGSALALLDGVQDAIATDGLANARAIRQPILANDDIANAFDGITYQKGAGVLGMFERWVGKDAFQRGVHDYLVAHRFKAAVADDFLQAESAAAGKDVKGPFQSFLDRPGVPFLETEVKCDGSPRLHVKQSRFLPLGSTADRHQTWQVPVCVRYRAKGETKDTCAVVADKEGDVPLGATCPEWVFPNANGDGYYRYSQAPADLAALRAKGLATLNVREKVAYANSLDAAFTLASLPAKEVLSNAAPLASDANAEIADAPMYYVGVARDWLSGSAESNAVEAYGRNLFHAEGAKLGWTGAKTEAPEHVQLRVDVLDFLATVARDPLVRAEAKKRGLAFLGDGKGLHPEAVDPNLEGVALTVAGEEGDAALWEAVHAQLAHTDDAMLRTRLVGLLAAANTPELRAKARDLAFDPAIRTTEALIPLREQLRRPETREEAWQWLKTNFDTITARLPRGVFLGVVAAPARFCDEAHAKDVEGFFTAERTAKVQGAPRVLASTVERIRLCAARRQAEEPGFVEFFGGAGKEKGKGEAKK